MCFEDKEHPLLVELDGMLDDTFKKTKSIISSVLSPNAPYKDIKENIMKIAMGVIGTKLLFPEKTYVKKETKEGYNICFVLGKILNMYLHKEMTDFHEKIKNINILYHHTHTDETLEKQENLSFREEITMKEYFFQSCLSNDEYEINKDISKYLYLFMRYVLSEKKMLMDDIRMFNTIESQFIIMCSVNVLSFLFGSVGLCMWPTDIIKIDPFSWVKRMNKSDTAKHYLLQEAYARLLSLQPSKFLLCVSNDSFILNQILKM